MLPQINSQLSSVRRCTRLPSSGRSNADLHWVKALAVADPTADGICDDFQDLVVSAAVAPFALGFWSAAKDVFQSTSPLSEGSSWCFQVKRLVGLFFFFFFSFFPPMRFTFPQLGPSDPALYSLTPDVITAPWAESP